MAAYFRSAQGPALRLDGIESNWWRWSRLVCASVCSTLHRSEQREPEVTSVNDQVTPLRLFCLTHLQEASIWLFI